MRSKHRAKCVAMTLAAVLLSTAAGCALRPTWHWEKAGADDADLTWDQNQCKAKVYAGKAGGLSGDVTNETVRHMFACMEGKGWTKRNN